MESDSSYKPDLKENEEDFNAGEELEESEGYIPSTNKKVKVEAKSKASKRGKAKTTRNTRGRPLKSTLKKAQADDFVQINEEWDESIQADLYNLIYFRDLNFKLMEEEEYEKYYEWYDNTTLNLELNGELHEFKHLEVNSSNGYDVMNTGLKCYSLDFNKNGEYIALTGNFDKEKSMELSFNNDNLPNIIQVWDILEKKIKLSICHNFGILFKIKWYPILYASEDKQKLKSIGCLIINSEDGKIRVLSIPNIDGHNQKIKVEENDSLLMLEMSNPNILYYQFEIFNDLLFTTSIDGNIVAYNIKNSILNGHVIPKFIIQPHSSPISYIDLFYDKYLVSCSYSGVIVVNNLEEKDINYKITYSGTGLSNLTTIKIGNENAVFESNHFTGMRGYVIDKDMNYSVSKLATYLPIVTFKSLASKYHYLILISDFNGQLNLCNIDTTQRNKLISLWPFMKVDKSSDKIKLDVKEKIPKRLSSDKEAHIVNTKLTKIAFQQLPSCYFDQLCWCSNQKKPFLMACTVPDGLLIIRNLK